MAKPGHLERGHVRVNLIREIAAGERPLNDLAAHYGVSRQAVEAFKKRHATRIAEVATKLDDEFAQLWATRKANRLAELQQDIEDVENLLSDPDTAAKAGVQWAEVKRIKQAALKAIADEMGDIPARKHAVEVSGALNVQLNGVNLDALT